MILDSQGLQMNHCGTSLHYANICIEVEHSESTFDHGSLMYIVKTCETI
jgi:hypothetical protein